VLSGQPTRRGDNWIGWWNAPSANSRSRVLMDTPIIAATCFLLRIASAPVERKPRLGQKGDRSTNAETEAEVPKPLPVVISDPSCMVLAPSEVLRSSALLQEGSQGVVDIQSSASVRKAGWDRYSRVMGGFSPSNLSIVSSGASPSNFETSQGTG